MRFMGQETSMPQEINAMNKDKVSYLAPKVELIRLQRPLHLLVSVSVEADFEDWELGDEL